MYIVLIRSSEILRFCRQLGGFVAKGAQGTKPPGGPDRLRRNGREDGYGRDSRYSARGVVRAQESACMCAGAKGGAVVGGGKEIAQKAATRGWRNG